MKSNLRLYSVLVLCWTVFLQTTWGQICQPDPIYIDSEFIVNPPPDGIGEQCSLNQGILNEPYEQTLTVVFPDSFSIEFNGAPIEFEAISFTIDAIAGLPSGVTYTCEPPDCVFTSNTIGCILLSGTPDQVGVYSLIIEATMEVNIGALLVLPIEIPNQPDSVIEFPPLGVREYIITIYPDDTTPQNCVVGGGVAGCTNACATNYDPAATVDDGSCMLPSADDGCDLTTDSIDSITCEIINTPNCPPGEDFDVLICECINLNTQCNDLFISEYVEGANNNKALEIYNPTPNPVNLSGYAIGRFSNGATVPSTGGPVILPNVMLQPYDTYVIVLDRRDTNGVGFDLAVWNGYNVLETQIDPLTNELIIDSCREEPQLFAQYIDDDTSNAFEYDNTTYNPEYDLQIKADTFACPNFNINSSMSFNGNDAVFLISGSTIAPDGSNLIDVVGVIGEDPQNTIGQPAWIDNLGRWVTRDATIVRRADIQEGTGIVATIFGDTLAYSDWIYYCNNDFTNLGFHACSCDPNFLMGCTDPCATNYDPTATEDDGSCVLPSVDDGCDLTTDSIDPTTCAVVNTPPDVDDGCPNTDDSFDAVNCEILNVSNCPSGTVLEADVCTCMPVDVVGCTDMDACNFDPAATMDNGSCIYTGASCDDGNSFTDDDTIQADCSCAGIPNGEEVPTVGEWGLIILALLLLNIAVLGIRQREIRTERV